MSKKNYSDTDAAAAAPAAAVLFIPGVAWAGFRTFSSVLHALDVRMSISVTLRPLKSPDTTIVDHCGHLENYNEHCNSQDGPSAVAGRRRWRQRRKNRKM